MDFGIGNRKLDIENSSKGSNELKIKFGGEQNEINVHTLLKSLANITTAIDEINNEVGTSKIEIKIKALEKGSFLVNIGLTEAEMPNLLSGVTIGGIVTVIKVLVEIFKLKKLLKNDKPAQVNEDGDNYSINTEKGNVIIVQQPSFNIYNSNVKVNEAISDTFEVLDSDSSVTSFEIKDEREAPIFEADREEFTELSARNITEIPEEGAKIETTMAILNIVKIVWDIKRKWQFYYRGIPISAHILDRSFFSSIDKGEKFAKGDTLEVELQITKRYNEAVNTYIDDSYKILKVIRHVPRSPQGKLNF